jgi:rhamnose utilization protein RhaD (predicted bifunctional aldolase and dehydrogenase)
MFNSETLDYRVRGESSEDHVIDRKRRFSELDNSDAAQADRAQQQADNYQAAVKQANKRRFQMQLYVFFTALARFYLLGMLELNSFVNSITGKRGNVELIMSVFSFVIFG